MKDLSKEEFRAAIDSSVHIKECPHRGHSADIMISMPMYGRTGARVQCPHCKCQTPYCGISEMIHEKDGKRIGTPITPEALLRGILEAVKIWNGHMILKEDKNGT